MDGREGTVIRAEVSQTAPSLRLAKGSLADVAAEKADHGTLIDRIAGPGVQHRAVAVRIDVKRVRISRVEKEPPAETISQ